MVCIWYPTYFNLKLILHCHISTLWLRDYRTGAKAPVVSGVLFKTQIPPKIGSYYTLEYKRNKIIISRAQILELYLKFFSSF